MTSRLHGRLKRLALSLSPPARPFVVRVTGGESPAEINALAQAFIRRHGYAPAAVLPVKANSTDEWIASIGKGGPE